MLRSYHLNRIHADMTSFVYRDVVGITKLSETRNLDALDAASAPPNSAVRLYRPDAQALAKLAIGTCVVIATLLAIPDAVALIPNAVTPANWMVRLVGVWLSAAILWFVGFLAILHVVSWFVKGVEVSDRHVRLWRYARPISMSKIAAVAIEPQHFFSRVFALKPVAKRLTLFETKKSWRKATVLNLVPHHLPSFFFAPEEFSRLSADIVGTKFGITGIDAEGMFAETSTFSRLKAMYKTLWWQRIAITLLISVGLVLFLSRKAIVHYEYNDGNKAMRAHQYEKARDLYKAATSVDPAFAHGWNNLANAEFELNNFTSAKGHWQRALFYKPDFVETKLSLAYLCLQQRDFKTAKGLIDSALNLSPDNTYAMVNRADYELRIGRTAAAIKDAQFVMASDHRIPRFTAACIYAQAMLQQDHAAEAQRALSKLARIPNPKAHNGENITLRLIVTSQLDRSQGKIDEAKSAITWALARAPLSSDVLLEKARVELAGNDLQSAETTLSAAERLAPDNPWVYVIRAQMMLTQSKSRETIEVQLNKAFACKNQDAQSLAQCGKLYAQIGLANQGAKCASESVKIQRGEP